MKVCIPEILNKVYFAPISESNDFQPNTYYKEKVSRYGLGEYECLDIERVFKYAYAYEQVIECYPNKEAEYSEGLGSYIVNYMTTGDIFSFSNIKDLERLITLGADIQYATDLAHKLTIPSNKRKTITKECFKLLCFLLKKGCPINKSMIHSASLWDSVKLFDEFFKYKIDFPILNYGLGVSLAHVQDIKESGLLDKFIKKGATLFDVDIYNKILEKDVDRYFVVVEFLKRKYGDKYKDFIN